MTFSISRFAIRLSLVLIIFLTMAACGQSDDAQSSPVIFTENDSGSQVVLRQGQVITISLRENGSTGYIWEIMPGTELFLTQQGDSQYVPNSNVPGSGGIRTFTFMAITSGNVTLKIINHRPWETNVAPSRTFEVAITVAS
jgi:inhibitor of cysteine peptidase